MNTDNSWNLFLQTGSIESYLSYRALIGHGGYGIESGGFSSGADYPALIRDRSKNEPLQ